MPIAVPSHTQSAFNPKELRKIVLWVSREAKKKKISALAATGHSGLVVASAVSFHTGIPLIAVRRNEDRPRADRRMLNTNNGKFGKYARWAFVDDLIATGHTLLNVIKHIEDQWVVKTLTPTAIFVYATWITEVYITKYQLKECSEAIKKINFDKIPCISYQKRPEW